MTLKRRYSPGDLRHHRDAMTDLDVVMAVERKSRDLGGSRRRRDQRAECPDGRGFARAVRAKESEDLSSLDAEGDVLESDALTELLGEVAHHDHRLARRLLRRLGELSGMRNDRFGDLARRLRSVDLGRHGRGRDGAVGRARRRPGRGPFDRPVSWCRRSCTRRRGRGRPRPRTRCPLWTSSRRRGHRWPRPPRSP